MPLSFVAPGQNARLTSTGTAGQRMSVHVSSSTLPSCNNTPLQILKPDGAVLASSTFVCTNSLLEPATLPLDGTYTVFVNPLLPGGLRCRSRS